MMHGFSTHSVAPFTGAWIETHMTVWKVKAGKQDNFSYETVKRLSEYLEERP